ncbi:MAG: kinase-like domain-containing protein, partial [Piptocephalis tieghemiana]
RREVIIWKRLRHPHILPLLESWESSRAVYAVTRRAVSGSLLEAIGKNPSSGSSLSLHQVQRVMRGLCEALRYLHEDARVIHGDVKLENILLAPDGHALLTDFGLSVEMGLEEDEDPSPASPKRGGDHSPSGKGQGGGIAGSVQYCSPEKLKAGRCASVKGGGSTPASDMWAVGVVGYAALMGRLPFDDGFHPRLLQSILMSRYPTLDPVKIDSKNGHKVKAFIESLLQPKVELRMTARQCLLGTGPGGDWLLSGDL